MYLGYNRTIFDESNNNLFTLSTHVHIYVRSFIFKTCMYRMCRIVILFSNACCVLLAAAEILNCNALESVNWRIKTRKAYVSHNNAFIFCFGAFIFVGKKNYYRNILDSRRGMEEASRKHSAVIIHAQLQAEYIFFKYHNYNEPRY